MIDDLGLGIIVSLKDAFTQNAQRISGAMNSLDSTVAAASERISTNMDRIQKGTMMVGAGLALMAVPAALITSTAATQKALGELASLGVQDLNAIEDAAESFSNSWAGTGKAQFVGATYDIKSALSNLSDEAVGVFTSMAALTGKATKATTQEMVGAFTTAYGIFKPIMSDMTDMQWAQAFSGTLSKTVALFKTTGPQMADAIKNIGAVAAASNVPMEEQLAILGQLQTTMPGSEAGTLYKAFIMKAAEAGQELGLSFIDTTGRIKGIMPVLQEIKKQFPDLSQAAAQVKLKKAFGSDEAVKFVLQMSAGMNSLEGNIQMVGQAMKSGTAVTEEMATAMNQDIGARFGLLRQQLSNLFEILGRTLLPVVTPVINSISRFILFLQKLAKAVPGVTATVLTLALGLGAILTVAGLVTAAVGTIGVMLPAIKAGFIAISAAAAGTGSAIAAWFLPVTAAIAGVILVVYLLKKSWETNFGGIQDVVMGVWNKIQLAFEGIKALISSLSGVTGQMSAELAGKLQAAGLLGFVVTVFMVYYRIREFLSGIWQAFSQAFAKIRAILEPAVKELFAACGTLFEAFSSVIAIFGSAATSVDGSSWRKFGSIIGTVAGVLLQGFAFALKGVVWYITLVVKTLALIVQGAVWVGRVIGGAFISAAGFVYKFFLPVRMLGNLFLTIGKIISTVWQVISGDLSFMSGLQLIGKAVFDFLATPFLWARDVISGVWSFITGLFNSMLSSFTGMGGMILAVFQNLPLVETMRNIFATLQSFLAGDLTFFESGKKLLITLGQGIWSSVTFPFTMLKNALGKLRNLLPFSDAKEGPLSNLTASGSALLGALAEGMKGALSLPAQIFKSAGNAILGALSSTWDTIKNGGQSLIGLVSAPFSSVGNIWTGFSENAKSAFSGVTSFLSNIGSNLLPELSIPQSWSSVWNGLSAGAAGFKTKIATAFSGIKDIVSGSFTTLSSQGSQLWSNVKTGVGGALQSVKGKASGLLGGAWNKVNSFFSGDKTPEAQSAAQLPKLNTPVKSSAGITNTARPLSNSSTPKPLVPQLLTASMLLNPVMGNMPVLPSVNTPPIPLQRESAVAQPRLPGTILPAQAVPGLVSSPTVNLPMNNPTLGTGSSISRNNPSPQNAFTTQANSTVPINKPSIVQIASASPVPGGDLNSSGNRDLLTAILSRLEALADRPINLTITTQIDGRQVAEAVYKNMHEKKIRNYGTV